MDELEQIKQLKARYFRFLDCKEWDNWRTCFTDDFTALYQGDHPDLEFASADELVQVNRELLAEVSTVHQGHTPEIVLVDDLNATGVWSMYDRVELPGAAFEGWGHYHEKYRKEAGEWKIAHILLTRLKVVPLQA